MPTKETTKLYGDGRHARMRFRFDGRNYEASFENGNRLCTIAEFGAEIPKDIAEHLYDMPNSGVFFPGSHPKDAGDFEEYEERKGEEARNAQKRGEQSGSQQITHWPTDAWTMAELGAAAARLGVPKRDYQGYGKADLLTLVQEKTAQRYPGLAEQHGFGGKQKDEDEE